MGRKPNQLILEYFERGPKLEDASNRYQHTCKSCGEKVRSSRMLQSAATVRCEQTVSSKMTDTAPVPQGPHR